MIVGRERELQDVGQLVAGWDAGPAVLVVEGEAGIGKTTIWEGGLEAAGPARVLVARAAQGEMPLSFAAVADLLGSYARAGKGSVTLKLSRKGKRALRRARKLTATLTLTFTPRGGQATKASGKVSLRR